MEETYLVGAVIITFFLGVGELFHPYRVKKLKKDILRGMLSDERWEWRTIESLKRGIREDDKTTRELLIEIGARASTGEKEVWTW